MTITGLLACKIKVLWRLQSYTLENPQKLQTEWLNDQNARSPVVCESTCQK